MADATRDSAYQSQELVNGTSTNLAIGNPLNKLKFKPDAAT
jgi:hypothetical protein